MTPLTEEQVQMLLALPRPDTKAMNDLAVEDRNAIDNRVNALVSLIEGHSVREVARTHGLTRRTCKRMLTLAVESSALGDINGFAVCMKGARLVDPAPRDIDGPLQKRPYDMLRLLEKIPKIKAMLTAFRGDLPSRTQTSPKFNRLCTSLKGVLKEHGLGQEDYPLNSADGGRRAWINAIKRIRVRARELAMLLISEPGLTKWSDLGHAEPFDETQLDGHYIDLKDQWCAIPLGDGTYKRVKVSGLVLLVEIDIASRACVGWTVLVDQAYNQYDFLRTIVRGLMSWRPKDMAGRRMRYLPNAWMPSAVAGPPMRALRISVDNASSHLAKHARGALRPLRLGLYRFGNAGLPETRPHIEAFFGSIEHHVLRYLAGGFEPETKVREEQVVSPKSTKQHPLFLHLLEDFLDIVFSTYNVTPHAGLNDRTPREVIETWLAEGGMPLRSTRTAQDIIDFGRTRLRVTVRGGGTGKELPHINHVYATYRSDKLSTRTDLVGKSFNAYVEEDARYMTLLDDKGLPYLQLKALAPYGATRHTLEERRRAHRWKISRGGRWEGVHDLIADFHAEVREAARHLKWAADDVASGRIPSSSAAPAPSRVATPQLEGLTPLGGPVSLRRR
ncbi:MAG TPA: hypothetical protein VGD30_07765 [Telluria sp.]